MFLYAVGTVFAAFTLHILLNIMSSLFFSPLSQLPGPKLAAITTWWQTWHLILRTRFKVIDDLHRRYGPVVRIGPNELSFSSPETFQKVFVSKCSRFLKADFYASIQPGVGEKFSGLFNYIDHRQSLSERKDLQVFLSTSAIRQYEIRFEKPLNVLLSKMEELEELDMFVYFKYLMLDAVGDIAFNQSFDQLESGHDHQYVIDFNNAFTLIGLQNTFSWLVPFIPFLPSKRLREAKLGLGRLFEYSQARVREFVDLGGSSNSLLRAYLDPKTGQPKPPYSQWSIALAGHGFIVAGSESSAITLTYILWLLIRHPAMQRKLREELKTLQPGYTISDLSALPYLDAVVKETLRVYPPAPAPMPRVVPPEGLTLKNVTLPPKTIISAQPYSIHRDPKIFVDPDIFNPERWLVADAAQKEVMARAFVPFSAGQRGCIGRGLAWMHLLRATAALVQKFEGFELTRGMTDDDMVLVERGALAVPKGGKLWVRVRK